MKLTTVFGSTNNNPAYYRFIPAQIKFWGRLGIRFCAGFVGESLPEELLPYKDHIVLWNRNLELNTAYVAQNLRMYYVALLNLPEDELVMITDMDMLPIQRCFFTDGLEHVQKRDFVHYHTIAHAEQQVYMCYNAAHPDTWKQVFGIANEDDISELMCKNYESSYTGVPGGVGWFSDQIVLYKHVMAYPHRIELHKPIRRIETWNVDSFIRRRKTNFGGENYDAHFHRSFDHNRRRIQYVAQHLGISL